MRRWCYKNHQQLDLLKHSRIRAPCGAHWQRLSLKSAHAVATCGAIHSRRVTIDACDGGLEGWPQRTDRLLFDLIPLRHWMIRLLYSAHCPDWDPIFLDELCPSSKAPNRAAHAIRAGVKMWGLGVGLDALDRSCTCAMQSWPSFFKFGW